MPNTPAEDPCCAEEAMTCLRQQLANNAEATCSESDANGQFLSASAAGANSSPATLAQRSSDKAYGGHHNCQGAANTERKTRKSGSVRTATPQPFRIGEVFLGAVGEGVNRRELVRALLRISIARIEIESVMVAARSGLLRSKREASRVGGEAEQRSLGDHAYHCVISRLRRMLRQSGKHRNRTAAPRVRAEDSTWSRRLVFTIGEVRPSCGEMRAR